MRIIQQLPLQNPLPYQRSVLTIGSYDGVHRGHKRIINTLKQAAKAHKAASALVTFYPRPKALLRIQGQDDYLTTVQEKLLIFQELGLDIAAILPFTRQLAQTPARDFVQQLVEAFHPLELWVGPDFRMGKDRQGDIPTLKKLGREFGFRVKVVDQQLAGGEVISSTRIRAELAAGRIREVTRLLGSPPFFLGQVVKGCQRGRTIGFPTANVAVDPEKLLPADGVYAVWMRVDNKVYPAVANIGVRPTFDDTERTVEVHIFDFQQDIYGQQVRVDLVERLRPEQKFNGLAALKAQIELDSKRARAILSAETT